MKQKQKRIGRLHRVKRKRNNRKKANNIIANEIGNFFSGIVIGFITTMARDMERNMQGGNNRIELKKIEKSNKILVRGEDGIYREKE
jgi:hypothetical protein